MGITYRREIDGLRAIAVLAVVLYHAGIGSAGFVGVDVFFVISGYLITSLLLKEHADTGGIDLLAFYARRVRRIFPAAALVVLATIAASTFLLSALQQAHVATSGGAALAFAANVYFQLTSGGYFDDASDRMPLLHLWSLSVEEQFYVLWPALLLFTRSRKAFAMLAVASFALAEWWIAQGSDAAFYQMPARFWELAAGGLIAAAPARRLPAWAAPLGIIATLGACAIPVAGHFPGYGALPAVLGATLVIASIHGGAGNRFLASRPMVGVGLISYSLYLWHWPLLAFYRALTVGDGELQVRLILCGVAVLLAVASHRYVEQPFRKMRFPSARTVATGAALSAMLAVSACALGWHTEQAPDHPLAAKAQADYPSRACHASGVDPATLKCRPASRTLVWGDSMAYSWLPAFPGASDVSRDACPPMVGYLPPKPMPGDFKCRAHNAAVLPYARGADTVILVRWWRQQADLSPLAGTLDQLKHVRRVVIVGPTPTLKDRVPDCIRLHAESACAVPRQAFDAEAGPILAKLRTLAAPYPNVEVLDVSDDFCTPIECPAVRNGVPLYYDSHHPTVTAVKGFPLGERRVAN